MDYHQRRRGLRRSHFRIPTLWFARIENTIHYRCSCHFKSLSNVWHSTRSTIPGRWYVVLPKIGEKLSREKFADLNRFAVRYAVTSSLARPCNFDALLASQRFSLTTPTPNTGYETSNFTFNSGPRTSGTLVVRMSCANTDPDFPTTLYLDDITVTLIGPS